MPRTGCKNPSTGPAKLDHRQLQKHGCYNLRYRINELVLDAHEHLIDDDMQDILIRRGFSLSDCKQPEAIWLWCKYSEHGYPTDRSLPAPKGAYTTWTFRAAPGTDL